jgi:hypothetical protein
VLLNMASVYRIVAIRVNETSWAHAWRLRFRYLGTGYDRPGWLSWADSKVKLCWAGSAELLENGKRGQGRERPVGLDSDSSWVSDRYRIGARKILFFFQSFYNLQTNLNSIQI